MPIKNRARRHFAPKKLCQVFLFVVLSAASSLAYQIITPFWAPAIDSALNARNNYYKSVLPDTSNFSLILIGKARRDEVYRRLLAAPDSANPWYYFICGGLKCTDDSKAAAFYFTSALSLASRDPGTTWALFVECTRNRQTKWADRCLMYLEKQFLESGASGAPAITQQLFYYALLAEGQKNNANAAGFYSWAERFDRNQVWTILYRLRKSVFSNPALFFTSLSALVNSLADSWPLQLAFGAHLYSWISWFLLMFLIAVFAGLSLRHLHKALHTFADHLPEHIPPFFKTSLPVVIIFSSLAFGLLPFFWILVFLLWHFLEKKERTLALFAVIILMLTPVDARIKDMFLQARMPNGPISQYARASHEGFSPEVYQLSLDRLKAFPEDPLTQLSAALSAMKLGDTTGALTYARNALSLKPDDPVIATTAGNIACLVYNYDTAAALFMKVISRRPGELHARFNLAQCYAGKSDTTLDLDFSKVLPRREQAVINAFVYTNNVYFARNWPPLRRLMAPEYKPGYFWRYIFPVAAYSGSWETTRSLWGASFLGIRPLSSLFIFLGLFILLIVWHFLPWAKKLQLQAGACRLCGRVICDHCKKKELCASCNQATQYIRNVKTLATIQTRIRNNRKLERRLVEYLLDICLPGSGMLYSGRRSLTVVLPIIFMTCAVYASYILVSSINLAYPHWVPCGTNENVLYFFIIYNGIFIIRALSAVFRRKGTVLQ